MDIPEDRYQHDRSFVLENTSDLENQVIVYEVNLIIKRPAYNIHKDWLISHMKDMVNENKFIKVNIYDQLNLDPTNDSIIRYHRITAQYHIRGYENLKIYLEKNAKKMRNQVIEKFGHDYEVSRRVFVLKNEIVYLS
jgi:hypothetical protein